MAPYASLAEEEALGILNLLRISNDRSLTILEQARFIDELRQMHQMSVADLAEQLSRSKAWVSMRLGLIGEMSEKVRQEIFSGGFPIYPYMYTLRQFMRMNGVKKQEIENFVVAVSGKKLSVREIEGELAQLPLGRAPTQGDWQAISERIRDRLDARIALLQRTRDRLAGCIGCGCLSLERCALYNPEDVAGAEGAGPRFLLSGAGGQEADGGKPRGSR